MRIFSVFSFFTKVEKKENNTVREKCPVYVPKDMVKICAQEVIYLARMVQDNVFIALSLRKNDTTEMQKLLKENQGRILQAQRELENGLMQTLRMVTSKEECRELEWVSQAVFTLEKLSVSVKKLVEAVKVGREQEVLPMENDINGQTLDGLQKVLQELVGMSMAAFLTKDTELAEEAAPLKNSIIEMGEYLKEQYIGNGGLWTDEAKERVVYQEIIGCFIEIAGHCGELTERMGKSYFKTSGTVL